MNILITGATGLIGKQLLKRLSGGAYKPRILVQNRDQHSKNIQFDNIRGDLMSSDSILIATKNIDTIIHLAGITHTHNRKLYYRVNTEGTANLLRAAEKNKVKKFIFISSRAASRDGGDYSHSKLLAEKKVKQSNIPWIILRLSEIYGAGEKEMISRLIRLIKKHKYIPVIGNGKYRMAPLYITDAVDVIISATKKVDLCRREYIIAGPEDLTFNEIINRIAGNLDRRVVKIYTPIFLFRALTLVCAILRLNILTRDQIPRLLMQKPRDIAAARKDLDFSPHTFEWGIKKCMN